MRGEAMGCVCRRRLAAVAKEDGVADDLGEQYVVFLSLLLRCFSILLLPSTVFFFL